MTKPKLEFVMAEMLFCAQVLKEASDKKLTSYELVEFAEDKGINIDLLTTVLTFLAIEKNVIRFDNQKQDYILNPC
jgi:hypothetical protein